MFDEIFSEGWANINWMGTNKTSNLKKVLQKLIQEGREIPVWWDAGGDQTIVNFDIKEEQQKKISHDLDKFYHKLRNIIVDKLSLPNAGEHYHEGKGKVLLDEEKQVVLEFTSREYMTDEYTDYNWDDMNEELNIWDDFGQQTLDNQQTKVLDKIYLVDKFNIKPHLNRLEVKLLGEFDAEFKSRSWININIMNGDSFDLKYQIEDFYKGKIREVLDSLMEKYLDKEFVGIYIEGILQSDHSVQFKLVENAYTILNIYKNKQVILFD